MTDNAQYSHTGFAATILRVMAAAALFFSTCMIWAHYQLGTTLDQMSLTFFVPAALYLSFVLGWGIAYTKFYRFPANQKVLLLGIAIAALIMRIGGGFSGLLSDQIEITEMLEIVPGMLVGTLVGATMQLYCLVVVLRYVFRWRLPF